MLQIAGKYRKALLLLTFLLLLGLTLPLGTAAAEPLFPNNFFKARWERADRPVVEGRAVPARSWLWGPESFSPIMEPYAESSGGTRQVVYVDKARLELNNPSTGFITGGLLVKELVSGALQKGDDSFSQRQPAYDIAVAGDPVSSVSPSYASFSKISTLDGWSHAATDRRGQLVLETLNRSGYTGYDSSLARYNLSIAEFEKTLKHNIPAVFWDFMNQRGTVYQDGRYFENQTVLGLNPAAPWLEVMGFPISEPYWTQTPVAGQVRDVLVQLFERRTLTYNPSNSPAFQVEMGNLGRHYFSWRNNPKYETLPLLDKPADVRYQLKGGQDHPNPLIKVVLSDSNGFERTEGTVGSTGSLTVKDNAGNSILETSSPRLEIKLNNGIYNFMVPDGPSATSNAGPFSLSARDGMVTFQKNNNTIRRYRGSLLIGPGKTAGKFAVVNQLLLEEYLYGNVPNEMPISFGVEPAKVQAVASRGYVLRDLGGYSAYSGADICDTTACQVYNGFDTEQAISNNAVDNTKGMVLVYRGPEPAYYGTIANTLYSSTAGGHTENVENVFGSPFPGKGVPYLVGVPDSNTVPDDLSDEGAASSFYRAAPPTFDNASRLFRWQVTWSRSQLEEFINAQLPVASKSGSVSPVFPEGTTIGTLNDIRVGQRGVSGKIMFVDITGSNGTWRLAKDFSIRSVFRAPSDIPPNSPAVRQGSLLPSSNLVFEIQRDAAGQISQVVGFGGGFGHGIGMSQFGAKGLADAGVQFDQILKHYYQGTQIEAATFQLTQPGGATGSTSFSTEFGTPGNRATLVVLYSTLASIEVEINGKTAFTVKERSTTVDLAPYVQPGVNRVTYRINGQPGQNASLLIQY